MSSERIVRKVSGGAESPPALFDSFRRIAPELATTTDETSEAIASIASSRPLKEPPKLK